MELIEAKITAMIALGLGSLISGLLPTLFTRLTRLSKLFLSSLLCFGAGVLLSTSLLHLLPEIREDLGEDNEKFAELILCGGFFILYTVDELVNFVSKKHQHTHQNNLEENLQRPQRSYGSIENRLENQNETSHVCNGHEEPSTSTVTVTSNTDTNKLEGNLHQPQRFCKSENQPLINRRQIEEGQNEEISQLCHIGHEEPCTSNFTGTFSLFLALTIHAILEGLAVGLENSTDQVLMMLAAVASHKLVVGFCLGAELSSIRDITPCQYFIAIGLFSFGSSLGIGIGIKIACSPEVLPLLLLPILQGLAGGTLLYVTVIEVLPRERAKWHKSHLKSSGILQLSTTILGFTVMTLLIFYCHT